MQKRPGAWFRTGARAIRAAPAKHSADTTAARQSNASRQILDAAAWLLRHRGYEATTTRAIADKVGIKAGSIYHHFPSKDAIVERVLDEGVRVVHDAVSASLRDLPRTASPRDRLEAAVKAHLLSSLEHSDYTSACIRAFAFLPDDLRQKCRPARKRYEGIWRMIVADGTAHGSMPPHVSQDVARLMLLGAVNWAGEWYRPGRAPIEEIARDFAAIAFGGSPAHPRVAKDSDRPGETPGRVARRAEGR